MMKCPYDVPPPKKTRVVKQKMSDERIREAAFLMLENNSFKAVIDFVISEVKNQSKGRRRTGKGRSLSKGESKVI